MDRIRQALGVHRDRRDSAPAKAMPCLLRPGLDGQDRRESEPHPNFARAVSGGSQREEGDGKPSPSCPNCLANCLSGRVCYTQGVKPFEYSAISDVARLPTAFLFSPCGSATGLDCGSKRNEIALDPWGSAALHPKECGREATVPQRRLRQASLPTKHAETDVLCRAGTGSRHCAREEIRKPRSISITPGAVHERRVGRSFHPLESASILRSRPFQHASLGNTPQGVRR